MPPEKKIIFFFLQLHYGLRSADELIFKYKNGASENNSWSHGI